MRIVYVVFHSLRWTTSEIPFLDVYQWCRKITYVYTYISPVLYTKYIYIRTKYMDEDGDVNKRGLLLSFFPQKKSYFILYKHRTDQPLNALQRASTHKCICVYLKRKGDKAD